jgi:hypothetical protein
VEFGDRLSISSRNEETETCVEMPCCSTIWMCTDFQPAVRHSNIRTPERVTEYADRFILNVYSFYYYEL